MIRCGLPRDDRAARSLPSASQAGQPVQPRLSAGVIPVRNGRDGDCEVYWVRRAQSLRFMGGWHAFPGGRLSSSDGAAPVHGVVDGADAYALSGQPAAHTACAFRELFEEAGFLPSQANSPTRLNATALGTCYLPKNWTSPTGSSAAD